MCGVATLSRHFSALTRAPGWYATERPLGFHSNGFRFHTKPQTRGKSGRNALLLPYFRPRFNLTLEHSLIRWRFDSLHHSGGAGISLMVDQSFRWCLRGCHRSKRVASNARRSPWLFSRDEIFSGIASRVDKASMSYNDTRTMEGGTGSVTAHNNVNSARTTAISKKRTPGPTGGGDNVRKSHRVQSVFVAGREYFSYQSSTPIQLIIYSAVL